MSDTPQMSFQANTANASIVTLTLVAELMVEVRILAAKLNTVAAGLPAHDYTDEQVDARYEALADVSTEARTMISNDVETKIKTLLEQVSKQQNAQV